MIEQELLRKKICGHVLNNRMRIDADLILNSVDFLEKQINAKLLEIDKGLEYNDIDDLKEQLIYLLQKLKKEENNMNHFMSKYERLVQKNEKKEFLPSAGEGEQIYLRGVPANKRGAGKSSEASKKLKKIQEN